MGTILLGLGGLCLLALVAFDLVIMRGADRFDGSMPEDESLRRVWSESSPAPAAVKAGRVVGIVLGVLSFPGTLAPVVITVLCFQAHPVLSHGWISLVAVIVAGISMSAAVKYLRTAHLLHTLAEEMKALLRKTLVYLGLWTVFVLVGTALMKAPETGRLTALIWGYVALSVVGFAVTAVATRQALGPSEDASSF